MLLWNTESISNDAFGENIDLHVNMAYFAQIKRLPSTKHKNTLLRVWNGDCLCNSRLVHFGLVNTNKCPRCDEIDSPKHMLTDCMHARRVWDILMRKIPKGASYTILQYAIGINDSKSILMLRAEILKYLMHYRELDPEEVIFKSIAYLKVVQSKDRIIAEL